MRTKDEILKQYSEEWLDSNDGKAISIVINLNMLEVWIDIRDTLNDRLEEIMKDIYKLANKE